MKSSNIKLMKSIQIVIVMNVKENDYLTCNVSQRFTLIIMETLYFKDLF